MRNRSWSTKLRALLEQHFFMSLTNSLMLLWNLVELEINSHCLDIRGRKRHFWGFFSVVLTLCSGRRPERARAATGPSLRAPGRITLNFVERPHPF